MIILKTNKSQLNQDPSSFQRKRTLNELQMFNIIFVYMYSYLLIQILQFEQKHIILESLM